MACRCDDIDFCEADIVVLSQAKTKIASILPEAEGIQEQTLILVNESPIAYETDNIGEICTAIDKMDENLIPTISSLPEEKTMGKDQTVEVMFGKYDADALFKKAKVEKEGLAALYGIDEYDVKQIVIDIKEEAILADSDTKRREAYEKYILWTGEPYSAICEVQSIKDIDPNDMKARIDSIKENAEGKLDGYDYYEYSIMEDIYLEDRDEQ